MAASQNHAAGMNNFGRCLEYGLGIEANPDRAAKFYRMAADQQNGSGENNFGICLERGIGVRVNLELAAEYYKRASDHGDADGANNFGFCLEHGRGVPQNIAEAAKYYKLASDRGHSEAAQNHRRCLRLLGRWPMPDRSRKISEQKPSFEEPPPMAKDPFERSCSAFGAVKESTPFSEDWVRRARLGVGEVSMVTLTLTPGPLSNSGQKHAVKTLLRRLNVRYFEREKSIHERLNHPLIVGFEKYLPPTPTRPAKIVTEFMPNGLLTELQKLNHVTGGTRIAIIVAGIVFAVRDLHFLSNHAPRSQTEKHFRRLELDRSNWRFQSQPFGGCLRRCQIG
jgi:hypothetical protein